MKRVDTLFHGHAARSSRCFPASVVALAVVLASSAASAQIYRSVGPDGRVTYSDKPTAAATERAPASTADAAGAGSALPYALRQTAQRYPVTLYTGSACAPCDSGRQLLMERGIPFAERSVASGADIEALQRLTGSSNLPVLAIGTQQVRGYSSTEWNQYLDAAGYPRTSQLPRTWQQPPASPLAPAQVTASQTANNTTPAATPAPASAQVPVTPAPTSTNPAGLRF